MSRTAEPHGPLSLVRMLHQASREAQTIQSKYGLEMPEYRSLLAILPRCKVRRMFMRRIGERRRGTVWLVIAECWGKEKNVGAGV